MNYLTDSGKSEDKKSDHFNALTPLLTEKIVKLAQEEIGELDASPFKNTYLLTKIPAVEVALAKKQIAPGLHSEEKILFLWGTKKLKNGYLLTDHRLFYRYASKKGVANWSDVSSVMFKTRIGSHALFVDGKAVAYEQDQNRMPARLKDYLNRYFYRVVTEVFERDTDQVPPVDFEEKELKAQKRAEVAGKIIGGAIAGTVAIAGAALSDKCEHSPIGKHAYVYGQCRYCGKKKPQGPLNI